MESLSYFNNTHTLSHTDERTHITLVYEGINDKECSFCVYFHYNGFSISRVQFALMRFLCVFVCGDEQNV